MKARILIAFAGAVALFSLSGCRQVSPVGPVEIQEITMNQIDNVKAGDNARGSDAVESSGLGKVINGKEIFLNFTNNTSSGTNKIYYSTYQLDPYGNMNCLVKDIYVSTRQAQPNAAINKNNIVVMVTGTGRSNYYYVGVIGTNYKITWKKWDIFFCNGYSPAIAINDNNEIACVYSYNADGKYYGQCLTGVIQNDYSIKWVKNTEFEGKYAVNPHIDINNNRTIMIIWEQKENPYALYRWGKMNSDYSLTLKAKYGYQVTRRPSVSLNNADEIVCSSTYNNISYVHIGRLVAGSDNVTWLNGIQSLPPGYCNDATIPKYGHINDSFYCIFALSGALVSGIVQPDGKVTFQKYMLMPSYNNTVCL